MLRFEQEEGTTRLKFRSSETPGAMVWEQPEKGAQLYIDLGSKGTDGDYKRISFPGSSGILALQSAVDNKVDKATGKGLSTNDYTSDEKTKLNGIESGAQKNTVISVAGKTGAVTLAKSDVGLSNVDNTSDANKPISTATQSALDGKQAKITANGFLKGDGTGIIAADKPVFWVTVTQNTTDNLYSADKTYSEIIEAYNNGYMVQAKYSVDDGTNKEIYSLMSTYRSGSVKMLYFIYLNDHEEKRFTCRVTATAEKWLYKESSLVPSNLTINNKPLSSNITLTPSDINAQSKITANGILKGDGAGNITAADETEVELVDLPQEIVWVKYTQEGSTASYNVINAQEILDAYKEGNKTIALKLQTVKSGVNKSCIMYLNFVSDYYIVSNRNYNFWFSGFEVENDVNTNITTIYPYYNVKLFIQEADGVLNNSLTTLEVHDKAKFPNPTYTKSISLPAASWTGSDPYTQTVTISSITTSKTRVNIQPSEEIYDQLVADNVGYLAIKNVDGTFTAVAKGGKPSVDLTVQVTYDNTVYY